MSKHHSTISRRDFMKGLGLAGAGLGAAAAAAPVFHDLDEFISSSPKSNYKNPWWIKEREFNNPTVEIDWDLYQRWDRNEGSPAHRIYMPYGDAETRAEVTQWNKNMQAYGAHRGIIAKEKLEANVPGWSLRDYALKEGDGRPPIAASSTTFCHKVKNTFEALGVPRWEGTPEENLHMVRAALHHYGSPSAGAAEINDYTRRFFYKNQVRFEDIDEPYLDKTPTPHIISSGRVTILPNKWKTVISFVVLQPQDLTYFGTAPLNAGNSRGYANRQLIVNRLLKFLKAIGYSGIGEGGPGSGRVLNVTAFGGMAGLAELGRVHHSLTPEWGTAIRMTNTVITDLPVAYTKPIDFGGRNFCRACKLCAEVCGTSSLGALDIETETSWEITGPWNNPGLKTWYMNYAKCPPLCTYCDSICPFFQHKDATIHEAIKMVSSVTSVFNSFFVTLAETFGYGIPYGAKYEDEYTFKAAVDWWNRDLNTYPYDCILF